MATALEDFPTWLSAKLQELKTDESVFGSYIESILESDESSEEKLEALQGILSEIIENESEINAVCNEILEKWQNHKQKEPPPVQASGDDVDTKLVKLLESQSLATTKQKKYTAEEKKIREAILMQYSQMTDDENEEEDVNATSEHKAENAGIEKNTNFQSVVNAEKVKREQAKLDSQKKKEKDKEDREKQKQMREEKKEKRKTQKGERRR